MLTKTFPRLAAALPLLMLVAAPAGAKDAAAAPVQLLQPGDAQLTCGALAAQINTLALAEAAPAKPKKRGFGVGSLTKVLGAAAPMLGPLGGMGGMGGGGIGGGLINGALGALQSGATDAQISSGMDAAAAAIPAPQSVEAQRKARLMGFFTQKGC